MGAEGEKKEMDGRGPEERATIYIGTSKTTEKHDSGRRNESGGWKNTWRVKGLAGLHQHHRQAHKVV